MSTQIYQEQVKRIKIAHYLFYKALAEEKDVDLIDYYFYSFCVACFQLKDYLKRDTTLPQSLRDNVENHINDNPRLKNVGVVANKYKHFRLTSPNWKSYSAAKIVGTNFDINNPEPVFKVEDIKEDKDSDITINTPHKSLYSWDKLFKKFGLDEPFLDYR